MKLVARPDMLNRLLKINVNYVNIRQSAEKHGYIDIVLQIDEDIHGYQRYVNILYQCPYISCTDNFDIFVSCEEILTQTQFCDKDSNIIVFEVVDRFLHIYNKTEQSEDSDFINIMKVPLSMKKRFNTDEIILFKNAHSESQKTELGYKHINTIIKNDRVVNKIVFVLHDNKIHTVSQSVIGTTVYHTNDLSVINQQVIEFKTQIEIDKQLLKKILYPVSKKTYSVSFTEVDKRLSFQLETLDDQNEKENLKIIIYNTSKELPLL